MRSHLFPTFTTAIEISCIRKLLAPESIKKATCEVAIGHKN